MSGVLDDDQSTGAVYGVPQYDTIPLNRPVIRTWELTSNSTHYDKLVAAPNDATLVQFWTGWATIMYITAIITTLILIPLLLNPKIRRNPFHYYLIFLMIPDCWVAWICGSTCLSNALAGMFTTVGLCRFQSFYMVAYIAANGWLNACVARHLYGMLLAAQHFRRYHPPTRQRVLREVVVIYTYSVLLGLVGIWDVPWWPYQTRLTIGAACIPMDYSTASTIMFYVVIMPLLFGIPLAYVVYAGYQIWSQELLPSTGRRRILVVYFFRLAAVFLIMWLPGLLLLFVTGAWVDPWLAWAGGSWSHLQGTVSALVSLLKPDIWCTVRDFWTCDRFAAKSSPPARPEEGPFPPSTTSRRSGRSVTFSRAKSASYWGKSSLRWSGNFRIPWSSHVPESQAENDMENDVGTLQSLAKSSNYADIEDDELGYHESDYAVDPDDHHITDAGTPLAEVAEGDEESAHDLVIAATENVRYDGQGGAYPETVPDGNDTVDRPPTEDPKDPEERIPQSESDVDTNDGESR